MYIASEEQEDREKPGIPQRS